MCDREYLVVMTEKGKLVQPDRNRYLDFNIWKDSVKVGDYVVVTETDETNSGPLRKFIEVITYDWWPFLPTNIKEWCAKR